MNDGKNKEYVTLPLETMGVIFLPLFKEIIQRKKDLLSGMVKNQLRVQVLLNNLSDELLDLVDADKIGFIPAVDTKV